ncbi:MAG: autotransporter domain-containing protein [Gemmatimonadetes bacterium]|nr:autotransporter domain-containing protein [Gemmatimonadota bacterium]
MTYSLEGELPAGLSFDGVARTISGTPPTDVTYDESYAFTYRVTDVDGDAVTLTFSIRVNGIPSFVQEQEDPQYMAGDAVSLELPEAEGGNVARTYRLDGELPAGLSFDPGTRTISGDLPEFAWYTFDGYTVTYRVADVDGEEPAPLVFTIRVNGIPRFDETVSEQVTFAEGQTIDPWVLPSASGGNGEVTYELVGELPEGLSYDGATRTISGTLDADATYAAESEGYPLTYQVMDQDGDAPEALVFTIVVHGMPSFHAQVVDDQLYTAGNEVILGLPEAVGGNGALAYSLEGELPPDLSFDGAARTISGTLPADYLYVAEGYVLTYRVTDVDGDAVTLRFTIAVNGIPSFGDQVVEDQQYTAGDAVSLELPEAVGGNVALTYFLDGELPPGLAFNPTARTISGELSPNVSYSPEGYALTYRVADVDGEEPDPLTFTISVNGMPFFEGSITNQWIPEGEEMAPLELPVALGGNGELTYSLSEENLPPGLAFDAASRTISGTPELHVSHPAEGYELTFRVEDEDGDSAELSFFLTVDGNPTFFDAVIEDRILRQNEAMDSWEFPAASGGNGDLTYTLDMNVPGLSFDAAARTLSGTPTHTGVYRLVYQVEDIDGDSAELTFHITVDGAPSFSGDVANQTYIDGEAIEDLVLPLASGGNLLSLNPDGEVVFGELTYTLDNVPPGLTFDPNPMSPMLSGTPTEVGTYTLTYTAHDSDDNMTAEDAAILSFEVRVEESATDRFAELNEQILSKYALAIADGTNRAIENRLEHMDRAGDENRSFRFAAESTLHDMIQSGRIFENRPVNLAQVMNGSSFATPFGFGRGCILCPGSPTFWGRGDYGQMSSDDGSLDWEGNLSRAQIGLDARPGAEMLTGLALSWAQGSFDYTAPLLGEERVDGTYETRMLSLHPYVGFSPGRLGVWLTAGLGRGNLDIDDEQGTIGQQSSDTSLRTASVGASGDLLASGPTQLRIKAAATVAQVEVEGGALDVGEGGNRIAEQTVSANRLRLAVKASHAYEAGMDGQVTPELEVALRQDGGDGLTGAGVEVGGGLRYEGGGFTLEAMARSLVSDGDDVVEYQEWGAHLLLQRSAGTNGRGLSLRVMPTYGTQANSLTLWERSVAEIADRGVASARGQLRAEVGYGLAALGGRGVYTVYSGMTQAPERMQLRLGTRFEVDSSMSVSLESSRWQRMAGASHGLLLRGRLVF